MEDAGWRKQAIECLDVDPFSRLAHIGSTFASPENEAFVGNRVGVNKIGFIVAVTGKKGQSAHRCKID